MRLTMLHIIGTFCFILNTSITPDLLLNFAFKLYHKLVNNPTATLDYIRKSASPIRFLAVDFLVIPEISERYFLHNEKSPNSFLPGLPRSMINQFRFHDFLCLCLASFLPLVIA